VNEVYILGLTYHNGNFVGTRGSELDFGVGEVGAVDVIHTYRFEPVASVNTNSQLIWFPVPMGNIPAGVRLVARLRCGGQSGTADFRLMYAENFDSRHKNPAPYRCWPSRDESITVTWSGTSWANSTWYQINTVVDTDQEVTVVDFWLQPGGFGAGPAELDLSNGAVGEEELHILTTKRFLHQNTGTFHRVIFPGGFPVVSGTRLSFRVRRSAAMANTSDFSWNYVYHTSYLS
jgi:hypothetical protein